MATIEKMTKNSFEGMLNVTWDDTASNKQKGSNPLESCGCTQKQKCACKRKRKYFNDEYISVILW